MSNKNKIKENSGAYPAPERDKVRILALGGLSEIGKNMYVVEYNDDLIVIDCGIAFPDEDTPGVDAIIPDFSYLRDRRQNIRGLFLTHGHEDHIGAVSWFMSEFNCPVYGTPMTIKLANNKILDKERAGSQDNAKLEKRFAVVKPGSTVQAGRLQVEFIHVNHSIADACALAVHTPQGLVLHSGDFKIDFTPIDGRPIDLNRFAELGREGILTLLLESTNVEVPGVTPSESMVSESFSDIFSDVSGRIFVATFSSNVSRIQQIISAAEMHNRKFVLLGYSMNKVFEAADSLGYIEYKKDSKIDVWDAKRFPDEQLVFITTGSQGEPMAALSRMAFSEHKHVNIKKGDTVILSSSMIPGNEKSIYKVVNELFRIGAEVIYEKLANIHVSGHAYREELKLLLSLTEPRYFIPIHGEYRHLYKNSQIAKSMDIPEENIFVLDNGDILELDRWQGAVVGEVADCNGVLIDGMGVGDLQQAALKERRWLADNGVVTCSLAVDKKKNLLAAEPVIEALGFIFQEDIHVLEQGISKVIYEYIDKQDSNKDLSQRLRNNQLREQIRSHLFKETKRKPVVIISVLEV